ncbi:MAG: LCP family protein [Porcipelethomonas sp.]
MKKKKTGSVAIPFLITFLISLILIGGAAMIIYDKIDSDESSLLSMVNEVGTLSEEDNHTILFTLDLSETIDSEETDSTDYEDYEDYEYDWEEDIEPASGTYVRQPYTFMIMRSRPVDKKMIFMGIPSNMLVGDSNKAAQDVYIDSGASALASSIEYTLGINIDRHMTLDSEAFKKICNILGGVTFAVPKGVEGVSTADGEQYLSAEQAEAIISCGNYSGGELQRISTASSLITAMLNQTNGERVAGNLDNSFNTIINMVESDISAIDYNDRKYAIKFMLKYSDPQDDEARSTRAEFITPYGSSEGKNFVADKYFAEDIKIYFESVPDDTHSENSGVSEETKEKSGNNE